MNSALSTTESPLAGQPSLSVPRRPRTGRGLILLLLVVAGLALALFAAVAWWGVPSHALNLTIDGDQVRWTDPSGWHGLAVMGGLLVAAVVLLLVVPLALLLGIALPLLIVALVLALLVAGALGVGLLLLSPLLLPLALGWWLWRRSAKITA